MTWAEEECCMQQEQAACLAADDALPGCIIHHLLRAPNVPGDWALSVPIPLVEDVCDRGAKYFVQHQIEQCLHSSIRN